MKNHKKSYCRCLCVILCALLFVPLLAAVSVEAAASSDFYSYNGHVLPDVSTLLSQHSSLPYIFIYLYDNKYIAQLCNSKFYVTSYDSSTDKYTFYHDFSNQSVYILQDDSWVFSSSASSAESTLVTSSSNFVWANYDISYSGNIVFPYNPPVDIGIPTVPSLTTSFDGQVISLDAGSLRFFITATNVNGTLSCQWYVNGAPVSGEWSFIEAEPDVWIQGWVYTPVENGTREIYCIVTNTIGDKSESVSTGTVIVHYGVSGGGGSGDLTEVTDKLDVLDMEISDLKQSVEQVQEGIDSINDALKVTDPALNDAVGAFDEGSAEVDAFEQQQWQDLEQNSHVVTDQFQIFSDTGTMVGAFTLVSGIVQKTFNSLGIWQSVLTIPLAVGIVIFIWSRVPSKMNPNKHRDDKPRDPKSRDPNV